MERGTGAEALARNGMDHERLRELASLDAIIERLARQPTSDASVAGAGTTRRPPLTPIQTRGAHDSALRKADPEAGT